MAELADATDLKSVEGKPHGGSSPPGAILFERYFMISTIIATTVLSSIAPPDYFDVHEFETDNWSGKFRVAYWEESDKFRYNIFLYDDSQLGLTYAEVFGAFSYDEEILPGEFKTLTVFGNGLGYEETYAYLFSDYDNEFYNFNTIRPTQIPGPATLGVLGALTAFVRRRRG